MEMTANPTTAPHQHQWDPRKEQLRACTGARGEARRSQGRALLMSPTGQGTSSRWDRTLPEPRAGEHAGARASTSSRLSPVLQPRKAPECQLMPVGTGRLVYMLHQISRKSGTASGARSCRSHLIPLSCQLGGAAATESDSEQQERLRAQPSPRPGHDHRGWGSAAEPAPTGSCWRRHGAAPAEKGWWERGEEPQERKGQP